MSVTQALNPSGVAQKDSGASRKGQALPHIRRQSRGYRLIFSAVCCLLFAVCSPPALAGAWSKQRTASLAWLHAVFFVDQNRGWAVGSRGTLLATSDGGKSWQAKPAATEDAIRDVFFSDELNGWLVCERNIYELQSNKDERAYLMKTSDGGEHWQRLKMRGATVDTRLNRAIFSRGHGWAFGEGGAVYTTRDAGASWNRLQAPTRYLLFGGVFIDENNGWLVGAGSTILQTSNGGETWQRGRLMSVAANATNHANTSVGTRAARFNSVSFVDRRQGWAVGSGGSIYRTVNGGSSWQPQTSGVSTDLLDVKFLDAREGWAVGDEGTVLHTTDGGRHWLNEHSSTTHSLERIFFSDRTHGWAVGFGGTIISYGTSNGRTAAPQLR
jgi:photosystem II stability/assembly factor-like uncharacterized protein